MGAGRSSMLQRTFIILVFICSVVVYDPRLMDYFLHSRFIATTAMLLAFGVILLGRRMKGSLHLGWLDITIILFCFWNTASLLWSEFLGEGLFAAQKWLLFVGAYLICRIIIEEGEAIALAFLPKVSRLFTGYILAIISFELVIMLSEGTYNNTSLYELQRLFGHRSLIAAFLMLLLPLNLIDAKPRGHLLTPINILVGWQMVVIVLLQSRAVYLALFLAIGIVGIFLWKTRKDWSSPVINRQIIAVLSLVVISAVAAITVYPALRDRLNPLNYATSQTAYERRLIWLKTADMVKDHPIMGVGAGNWKLLFPAYGLEGSYRMQDQHVVFTRVHNDFLEVLVELGLIGLLIYLGNFVLAWYNLWRYPNARTWQRLMVGLGLASFVVISLIDFPKERIDIMLLLALYFSLVGLMTRSESVMVWKVGKNMLIAALCLILSFLGFTVLARYDGEVKTKEMLQARSAEQWKQVIDIAEQAESRWYHLDPSTTPLPFYSGIAHYHLDDLDQAEVDFRRALAMHPYNFQVHNNLATVLLQKKNYTESIIHLEEALRINDRFEDALFNLAFCHYSMGNYEAALENVHLIPSESEKKKAFIEEIEKAMNSDKM